MAIGGVKSPFQIGKTKVPSAMVLINESATQITLEAYNPQVPVVVDGKVLTEAFVYKGTNFNFTVGGISFTVVASNPCVPAPQAAAKGSDDDVIEVIRPGAELRVHPRPLHGRKRFDPVPTVEADWLKVTHTMFDGLEDTTSTHFAHDPVVTIGSDPRLNHLVELKGTSGENRLYSGTALSIKADAESSDWCLVEVKNRNGLHLDGVKLSPGANVLVHAQNVIELRKPPFATGTYSHRLVLARIPAEIEAGDHDDDEEEAGEGGVGGQTLAFGDDDDHVEPLTLDWRDVTTTPVAGQKRSRVSFAEPNDDGSAGGKFTLAPSSRRREEPVGQTLDWTHVPSTPKTGRN